jgi:H+/Cl- antiporter ClcA
MINQALPWMVHKLASSRTLFIEKNMISLWQVGLLQRRFISALILITILNAGLTLLFSRLAQINVTAWLNQYELLTLAPISGALLLWWLYRRHQGHTQVGLVRVAVGYHYDRIPISWLDMRYQFFGGLIAVLSGFAVGIVGPAIYLSGWLASRLTARADFSWRQQRLALACGCATAIAVLFASPIGALLLVSETIIRQWFLRTSLAVLICALVAAGIGMLAGESVLSIHLPESLVIGFELPWFAALGGAAAVCVWLIQQIIYFLPIKSIPHGFMIAAIATAFAGLWAPNLLGLEAISPDDLLAWRHEEQHLWLWLTIKTLLTGIALAAVIPGGGFGPALVIGGLLGASFATLPGAPNQPLLVLAGMAAVLAVVLNAPLAATLLMVEHAQQWSLMLPTFIACISASLTLKYLLHSPSLLDFQLHQQGLCLLRQNVIWDRS